MVSAHRISLEGRSDGQDSQILDALARTAEKGGVKMNRKEAILRIKDHMEHHGIGKYPHLKLKEALDMAIAALSQPNEPLTLERLREMDGEPVWIVDVGPHKWYGPGWAIVDRDNCLVRTVKNWNPVFFERYGERWIAYRRPPEGEV